MDEKTENTPSNHAIRADLEKLHQLLLKAQEYRDFGDTKAYALEVQARKLVEEMMERL